jgi:hypothetical protein
MHADHVYMYSCVHPCLYAGVIHVCTYVCICIQGLRGCWHARRYHACIYVRVNACMYTCIGVCVLSSKYMHLFSKKMALTEGSPKRHACTCECMYACIYVCMCPKCHACTCECMYACIYVCMYAFTHIYSRMCTCVHACIQDHVRGKASFRGKAGMADAQ